MTFFTTDNSGDLVESCKDLISQRRKGENLPESIYSAAVRAGREAQGKSLEERRNIFTERFNTAVMQEVAHNRRWSATNQTIKEFTDVALQAMSEVAQAAGSFEDVADDKGSPLSAEDRARLNKRKVKEGAEGAGSFEDVADDEGSPLEAEDRARLEKRKVKEGAEGAGSFEDVADDEGSPLSAEDRKRLLLRKVKENLANFGKKKAKQWPEDKDGDGKINEQEDTGTDKDIEDVEQDERRVSVKAQTVRDIDSVPVPKTHSFVKESWTVILEAEALDVGAQHILAAKLAEDENITEATAACPTDRSPFRVIVAGQTEREAIENLLSALENSESGLGEDNVKLAHRTLEK